MTWNPLPPGRLGAAANLRGIDANLVWADASGWRDFLRPGQKAMPRIPVIAEIDPRRASAFAASVIKGGSIPEVYRSNGTTHCTAMLTAAHCRRLLRAWATEGPVRRLELQAPLIPQRPRVPHEGAGVAPRTARSIRTRGRLLIGVIDHGCPFAHRHLRQAMRSGTRILNLWLQDGTHHPKTLQLGATPSNFGYGLVLSRRLLNDLMQRHTASDGFVDEEACYAEAGMDELRQRFLHGAAVLDLFVSPRPLFVRTSGDPDRSPTWAIESNEAELADIVFVQLPRDVVQDSTSAGLTRCILDGLQYIVSCAGRKSRIVVNISDGSSRGSHDGDSIIETAMASLVAEQANRDRQVSIVLPAGNSRDEERHAQFDKLPPSEWCPLRLRLPPGCEAPSQLIIRIPATITDAEIRVVAPGEAPDRQERDVVGWGEAKAWPDSNRPACAVILPASGMMGTTEALITWAPTERFGDGVVRAPAGDWQIAVRSRSGSNNAVHFYIARNQINATALTRGQQAFFLDEGRYDPDRHLRSRKDDPNPPQSPIRRRGSLNSLATGPRGRGVYVVGSAFLRERTPTGYSSEGPAAGGAPPRQGPDILAPTDLSRALRGINASGTIGGQVVRVSGTSFAAPQAARARTNDQWTDRRIPKWLIKPVHKP